MNMDEKKKFIVTTLERLKKKTFVKFYYEYDEIDRKEIGIAIPHKKYYRIVVVTHDGRVYIEGWMHHAKEGAIKVPLRVEWVNRVYRYLVEKDIQYRE